MRRIRRNPLVKIAAGRDLDELANSIYDCVYDALPGQNSDVSQFIPHVIVQGDRSFPIDRRTGYVDEEGLDRDEYYDYEVDPEWEGDMVCEDRLRARTPDGRWVHADVQGWIAYEPQATGWIGDCDNKPDGSAVIRVVFNWAQEESWSPRNSGVRYPKRGASIWNEIRAILSHETVHWLDPFSYNEQDDAQHVDPRSVVLPWERLAQEKAYASDPREIQAFKREAFERLKIAWHDEGRNDYDGFPLHLWREVVEANDIIPLMLSQMSEKVRRETMRDITSAWGKHIHRWRQRVKFGFEE